MPNVNPKYWENQETIKLTCLVHKDQYQNIKDHLYRGQVTKLIRNVLESVNDKIKAGQTAEVVNYIHKDQPITLTPMKGSDHASDG